MASSCTSFAIPNQPTSSRMTTFMMRFAVVLLLVVMGGSFAFQSGGAPLYSSGSSLAFAHLRRQGTKGAPKPLQAAFIEELANVYSYGMSDYYLATQSVTGGLLCGMGDAISQVQERLSSNTKNKYTRNAIDFKRVFRFALKGLGGGIIWSQWYGIVDDWSLTLSNGILDLIGGDDAVFGDGIHRVARTTSAILLEQCVACPIVYSLWDIPFPMVMNGVSVERVPGQVRQKIGPLLTENAKVWSFVNIIIYNIPVEFRLLAMSVADIFWQSVIASVAAEAVVDEGDSIEQQAFDDDEQVGYVQNKAQNQNVLARLTE